MKKSLSRALSLALVLVLLLGAMPFALADNATRPAGVYVTPSQEKANVGDVITFTANFAEGSAEGLELVYTWTNATGSGATATRKITADDIGGITVSIDVSYNGEVISKADCPVAVYAVATGVTISGNKEVKVGETLQLTGTIAPAGADPTLYWKSSDETTATVDEKTGLVKGIKEGKVTITANSPKFPDAKGTYEVEVKASSAYSVEIKGAKDLYLNEKDLDTAQLSAKLIQTDTNAEVKDATFKWTSNDVVTVDSTGKVTALKAGDATVHVNAFVKGEGDEVVKVAEADVTFKVVDNAISCDNAQVPYSSTASYTLKPTVKDAANPVFTYEVVSGNGTVSTAGVVKPTAPGVIRVKITAAWTGHTVSKTVAVSFYDIVNATATVKTGVTSFLFSDTSVFSSVSIDNKTQATPTSYCMRDLYKSVYTSDWTYVSLQQADPSSTIASITYPGSTTIFNGFDPTAVNKYDATNALKLKFTCLKKGTFKLDYSLTTTEGLLVQYGTITINTQEGAASITYKTSYTTAVTVDEKDFAQYWKDNKMSSDLDYVKFGVSSVIPYYGELYTTNSSSTRKEVTTGMSFDYNATSKDTYDLDLVTFVPSASKKTSYTEEIPFTCYGTKSGDTLAGVMVIEVSGNLPFTDVKTTDWFFEDVSYVYNNDIMNGTSATTFDPNATLTRAMVVTMLYRIEGEPFVSYSSSFKDVPSGQWYTDAVAWAAKNDIVNGFDASTFGPSRAITREQLAAILYRYADYKGQSTSGSASLNKFYDSSKVSSYAEDAMKWAVYEGIINGDAGYLKPAGTATRAEAAAMFHRYLEG